jgi:hypothetical protein
MKLMVNLSDAFPIKNGQKQGDYFLQLLFCFAVGDANIKVQDSKEGSELNGAH